jgi:hypothetical protein
MVGGEKVKSKKALFDIKKCGIEKVGLMVELQSVILKDLNKLEKIQGFVNSKEITNDLKVEIIKNILKEEN